MESIYLSIVLAPLLAAVVAGLFGRRIGRAGAHWITIVGVGVSFVLSLVVLKDLVFDGGEIRQGQTARGRLLIAREAEIPQEQSTIAQHGVDQADDFAPVPRTGVAA